MFRSFFIQAHSCVVLMYFSNIQIICQQHDNTLRYLRKRRKADMESKTEFGPVFVEPVTERGWPTSSSQRGGAQPIKNAMASSTRSPPRPGGSAKYRSKAKHPHTERALARWGLSLNSSAQIGIHTVRLHKGLHSSQPPYG